MSLHLTEAHCFRLRKARRFTTLLLLGATSLALTHAGAVRPAQAAQSTPEVPGKVAPPSPETSPDVTGTNDGVITPRRDVDPGMSKAPPSQSTESMPVVKPKGTPGGPPGPEPK